MDNSLKDKHLGATLKGQAPTGSASLRSSETDGPSPSDPSRNVRAYAAGCVCTQCGHKSYGEQYMQAGAVCEKCGDSSPIRGHVIDERPLFVSLIGRRWRDGNGNTYHTVRVLVGRRVTADSKVSVSQYDSAVTYGYGDHYEQTARSILAREGIVPNDKVSLRNYFASQGIKYTSEAMNVQRKKDL